MKKLIGTIFAMLSSVCMAQPNGLESNINVTAINNFQAESYLGDWYEIARIPFYFEDHCLAPVKANYKIDGENIAVTNSCMTKENKLDTAHGMAYFTEKDAKIAKLEVTFVPSWLRFTHIGRGDYWVLYTDYQYSLVGSPNHRYLWILSRSETPDQTTIHKLLDIASQQGFDITKLHFNYPNLESMTSVPTK